MTASARRAQLIEVGRHEFATRGVTATTVEDIAAAAGVTKPVVYEHFGGKEGLYTQIVEQDTQALIEQIVASLTGADSPRAFLEHGVVGFLTYLSHNPDGARLLVRDAPSWHSTGSLASLLSEVATQIEAVLAGEMTTRDMDPRFAPVYAQMLVGMCGITGDWWIEHGKDFQLEEVAAHMVNFAWNGIRNLKADPQLRTLPEPEDPAEPADASDAPQDSETEPANDSNDAETPNATPDASDESAS